MEIRRSHHNSEPDEDGVHASAYFEGSFGDSLNVASELVIEVESGEDDA